MPSVCKVSSIYCLKSKWAYAKIRVAAYPSDNALFLEN
jgi:hypothetical protein